MLLFWDFLIIDCIEQGRVNAIFLKYNKIIEILIREKTVIIQQISFKFIYVLCEDSLLGRMFCVAEVIDVRMLDPYCQAN